MKDKKTHDTVWGIMQCRSYLNNDNKRFVYKENVNATTITEELNTLRSDSICIKTVRNTLKLYQSLGFIEEGKTTLADNKTLVDCYYLNDDFIPFKLIPKDTLRFLLNTATDNVIKVYVYLLNKYEWKQAEGEQYKFTLKELAEAIGYKESQNSRNMIKDILKSLKNNGLIDFKETYQKTENTLFPIMILTSVSLSPL
jgi:hypothetical protein